MMTQAQEFKVSLNEGFLSYPINEMDEKHYQETGKVPSGKFAKMLRRATPIADDVWLQSLNVKTSLHDLDHVTNFAFTDRGIESFIEIYAALNVEIQEQVKLIKKTNQEQPLHEYYTQFEDIYNVNCFDMLVDDISAIIPEITKRNSEYNSRHPDRAQTLTYELDTIKQYFKHATKKYKENRK